MCVWGGGVGGQGKGRGLTELYGSVLKVRINMGICPVLCICAG